MANRVMNTWEFGGVRLSSFGAVTELDDYLDIPSKRNDDVFIPLVDGKVHATKFFEPRTVTFGIEIIEEDICELETTFDTLKQLIGSRSQQYLSYISSTGLRRAYAEVVRQLSVSRDPDPLVAKIIIEFLMVDPLFRSDDLYSYLVTIDASPHAYDPINNGTAEVRDAIITFTGPSEHPKIEHQTSPNVWCQYDLHLIALDTVVVDCKNYTAVLRRKFTNDPAAGANIELNMPLTSGFIVGNEVMVSSSAGTETATITVVHVDTHITVNALTLNHTTTTPFVSTNVINYMKHGNDTCFMVLLPGGANHCHVTDSNPTTGTILITFYPPYL